MNITGLGRTSLKVRNLEASARFYSRVLRMPILSRCDESSAIGFRVGRVHEFRVEPAAESSSDPTKRTLGVHHIAFIVGNNPRTLEDAARHLAEHGVAFEQVAHEEYESLYLRDPDGHLIELYYWPEW